MPGRGRVTDVNQPVEITTEAEFEAAIERLFRSAHENGVRIEGGWTVRNGKPLPDWEAVIHELAKESTQ
jgi:hypothetical protein